MELNPTEGTNNENSEQNVAKLKESWLLPIREPQLPRHLPLLSLLEVLFRPSSASAQSSTPAYLEIHTRSWPKLLNTASNTTHHTSPYLIGAISSLPSWNRLTDFEQRGMDFAYKPSGFGFPGSNDE
ncbi:hypothetical protein V2G26_000682 [Clonostachys chloroleuca]